MITEWYSDQQSARTPARPGLERLRQSARRGRVPRLYVYHLDRLVRSGIRDTAKIERLAINARLASARLRLEQEGRFWGRPPRLTPPERVRIAALRRRGTTVREIPTAVRAARATVARWLSQKVSAKSAPGRHTGERPGGAAQK
jgi:DNA invertase Pin-like site-specific DNA recombinase